jgi:hypothetical protein
MLTVPEMIMIGGNSRNSGKTTMACSIITKLATSMEVIGLKVTSVRPGEEEWHGNHTSETSGSYTIFEETNPHLKKDTSKMLRAGASHVYYIQVSDIFLEKAVLHFLSMYINKQIIVCESRSLRNFIIPGLFLMMMRVTTQGNPKDVDDYLSKSDKNIYYGDETTQLRQFADNLYFENGKFALDK